MGLTGHPGGFVQDGGVVVPEKAAAACALAAQGEWLGLAWTGTDTRLNLTWSQDGHHFAGKRTLKHRSYRTETTSSGTGSNRSSSTRTVHLAPSLAWTSGGACLAWTGTDRRMNVWNVHLGPQAHIVLPERSSYGPALAAAGPHIALSWIGTDRQFNIAYGSFGTAGGPGGFGSPGQVAGATSSYSPAICHLPGDPAAPPDFAIAWRGTDRRLNISLAHAGSFCPPIILQDTSTHGPALFAYGQDLVLAWTGTDRRLNVTSWSLPHILHMGHTRQGAPAATRRATLGATSSSRPALAEYRGQLLIAWTGTDRRPNVARLSPV